MRRTGGSQGPETVALRLAVSRGPEDPRALVALRILARLLVANRAATGLSVSSGATP